MSPPWIIWPKGSEKRMLPKFGGTFPVAVAAWPQSACASIVSSGLQVIAKAEVVQLGKKQNPADALRTWLGTDQAKLSMEELDGLLALLTERKGQAEQHAVAVNGKLLLSFLQHCMYAQLCSSQPGWCLWELRLTSWRSFELTPRLVCRFKPQNCMGSLRFLFGFMEKL